MLKNHEKRIALKTKIIFALILLPILLVSCGNRGHTPTDIIYECIANGDAPASSIYFSEAEENSDERIESEQLSKLYNGMSPENLCSSYALLLSKDDSIYEIHIYKARSQIKADQIAKILYRRVEMIQKKDIYLYDEENYENIAASAKVYKRGCYVSLIITNDNSSVESIIKNMT